MSARRAVVAGLVLVVLGGAEVRAEPRFGTVTTLQMPKAHSVRDVALADVDADGRSDLVVLARRHGKRTGRQLRVHLFHSEEPALRTEPDAAYDLPDDVTAFGVADLDPEPGAEVVLFTASSVWVWRPRAAEERRLVRLLDTEFLWQMPEDRDAFAWDGSFHDVDGDGLTDLVIPEPDAYRIALQRRENGASRFLPVSLLRVPEDELGDEGEAKGARKLKARAERKRVSVSIQLGGDGGDLPRDLLDVTESVPAPQLHDFDGDGRADLVAQTPSTFHVWTQRADGTFAEAPDRSYPVPVPADRRRRLDVSYAALAADLDGDRRSDYVLLGSDQDRSDTRTQILVFTQVGNPASSPLFGEKGAPKQLLVVGGFTGGPRLLDMDGDGRRDLALGSVKLDGLDALAAASKGTIDAEILVWRNRGGAFSRQPDLRHTIAVKADGGFRKSKEGFVARFLPDVTGDKVRDLLVRDEPTRLRLFPLRRQGETFTVLQNELWEAVMTEDARIVLRDDMKVPEAVIVEDDQVRLVRWP